MNYLNKYEIFEKNNNIDNIDYETIYDELLTDYERGDAFDDIDDMINRAKKFILKIKSLYNNGKILIYRHMFVDHIWIESILNLENFKLGAFWSYNKEIAHSWDSRGTEETEVLLFSEIDIKYINWESTIILYFIFGGSETESELAISPDSEIKLISMDEVLYKETLHKYNINMIGYTI